jgi:drug/metabolite transporter (DMT)-like permease
VKGLQGRFERASLGAVYGLTSLLYFVIRFAIDAIMGRDVLDPVQLVLSVVGAALFGGVMVFFIARQRRRSGGASISADVSDALKARRLPADADPAVWIPALEWRRAQFARSRWLVPILFGLFALMGVLAFVLDPTSPLGWIVVAAFLFVGTVSIVQARRTLPRIDELLGQLRARDGARPPLSGDSAPVS